MLTVEASSSARARIAGRVMAALTERNPLYEKFFEREAERLALACREMSERFLRGGRLLAFGRGPYATDAQHVSVEFVHPVIVGKRALPALDLSIDFPIWLRALLLPEDMVMGFGPPGGDAAVHAALEFAESKGAMTLALPGAANRSRGETYGFETFTSHPFHHQEAIEILYHTLWETVHVFFERQPKRQDAGEAAFLYPFLGQEDQQSAGVVDEVADSILMKVDDDAQLRERVASEQAEVIAATVEAIGERVRGGGKLILFGNGGSATDANDWALDCALPLRGRPIPAISLALEPANVTAVANDVGVEVVFLRQMIAQARRGDVAIGISTSGGSKNVIAALEQARKSGLLTVALLGNEGGEIVRRGLADHVIVVRSDYIPRIQEVQASVYHVMTELLAEGANA